MRFKCLGRHDLAWFALLFALCGAWIKSRMDLISLGGVVNQRVVGVAIRHRKYQPVEWKCSKGGCIAGWKGRFGLLGRRGGLGCWAGGTA
jgi:hypothetical protein